MAYFKNKILVPPKPNEITKFYAFAIIATLAVSILPANGAKYPEARGIWISYFSTEGKRIAMKYGIPPPPIQNLPMVKIDPPRNAFARQWDGAFCREWDDGCTKCTRDKSSSKSACGPITATNADNVCIPHLVRCTERVDHVERICGDVQTSDEMWLDGHPYKATRTFSSPTYVFLLKRDDKGGLWEVQWAEDSLFPPHRPDDKEIDRARLSFRRDSTCAAPQTDALIKMIP